MPPDATLPPRSARPWYATDSGRAGVALSVVTIMVLAIGFAVIHGASSSEPTQPSTPAVGDSSATTAKPAPLENREQWIVIKGTAPPPTQLPTPQSDPQPTSLPFTAERPNEGSLNRL